VSRRRGLLLFAVVFCAAFSWLRATSTFARVEGRIAEVRAAAARSGLEEAEVMALLDLGEGRTPSEQLTELATEVARARDQLGATGLAVAAVLGHGDLVRTLRAGASPADALAALQARREGLVATRFATMAERYRAAQAGW
jgi:hypothetical protein